jgi:hypothetical protein
VGFNKRKMEDRRRQAADKDAAARRATDAQVLEDAEQRSAPSSPPAIGSCGFAARPAGRSTQQTCALSIGTAMLR